MNTTRRCVNDPSTFAFRTAGKAALLAFPILLTATSVAHAQFGTNLIANSGAESGTGTADGSVIAVPGWTPTGTFTAVQYGASGGFPSSTDPGPVNRGTNFFAGGPSAPVSTGTQAVSVSSIAGFINTGGVSYVLSGWLGGFDSQDDNAILTETFIGTSGTLGSASIGPVLSADRGDANGLLFRMASGAVPVGTTSIQSVLTFTRTAGTYNDGYADNVSMVLTNNSGGAATAPETSSVALLAMGLPPLLATTSLRRRRRP